VQSAPRSIRCLTYHSNMPLTLQRHFNAMTEFAL
jgi:hypothetical protein